MRHLVCNVGKHEIILVLALHPDKLRLTGGIPSMNQIDLLEILFKLILRALLDACGETVMFVRNGVQIIDEAVCISHGANILGKGMNPYVPPFMYKYWDTLSHLGFVRQLV